MRIHKPDDVEVVLRSYVDLAGRRVLSVGIVSSFALHPDAAIGPREQSEVWPLATAAIGDAAPLDEGWAKLRAEFFVYGAAYMPRGRIEQPISVRAQLGSLQKQLAVYGDRTLSAIGPSDPAPFWKMPLTPQNAFGGQGHDMNPLGKGDLQAKGNGGDGDGAPPWPLPNIEDPDQLVISRADRPDPAGFWALSADDSRRMRHFGTVDERWLKTRWPHLPLDTDSGYFQAALQDQQASGFWRGDEPFALYNLHPVFSVLEGKLPGLAARVLAAKPDSQGDLLVSVAKAVPETVWFFPDHLKGLILHRAVFEVDELDADDIAELYTELEPMSAPAPSMDTLKARLLVAIAAADQPDGLLDFELETEPESEPTSEELHASSTLSASELTQPLDALEQWQDVPASQELPLKSASLVPPMTPKIDPQSAAELAALKSMIERSKQTIQSAFQNTSMTEKDLLEMLFNQPDAPDMPDVFAKAPNGITGVLDDLQADIEKLFISDAQINAIVEQEALEVPAEPEPVPEPEPVVTTEMRQTVVEMHGRGESLADLDLSATDLSGLDLSGADFTGATLAEVSFAGAELERCKFDNAILSGAVFAGAMLQYASFKSVSAGQSSFEGAKLDSAVLFESDFSGSNFSRASLASATLRASVFSGAQMGGVNAANAVADEAVFDEANLDGADLSSARLKSTQFSNASMIGANLSKCIAPRVDLSGAQLSGANLAGAYLEDCTASETTDLSKAILRDAILTSCNWHGVNLEGADLCEASMDQADLMGANLRNAKMIRAVARGACLDKADLTGMDASAANLFEAGLRGAKIKETLFSAANLFAADFSDAVIDSVDLEGANIERTIIKLRNKAI